MVCVACAADVPDEDVFCENCGVRLPHPAAEAGGCTCGAALTDVDEDGYCMACGKRVRRPPSDHIEETLTPGFAAVSDRGLRHERNEDRFALAEGSGGFGLVVCDGVSATENSEVASGAASAAIGAVLAEALAENVPDPEQVLEEAIAKAAESLRSDSSGMESSAPSTTAVAALVSQGEITVAWVGDSRAYWIDEGGAHLLTRDHSWRNMVLANGEMSEEQADAAPQAHAITRWLGADAAEAATPEVARHQVETNGTLLLCSDGLWNYAEQPQLIAELVRKGDDTDALELARALVTFANEQGGRDNITVAVLRVVAPARAAATH